MRSILCIRPLCALRHLVVTSSLVLLAACGGGSGTGKASQVAVKVNDGEISVHQVQLATERELSARSDEQADAITRRTLTSLVQQELAAQAARRQGLDKDPRVVQLMELSRREVLARAYQDRLGEAARAPSSDEVDQYFDAKPLLFAQRKLYSLQETTVHVAAAQADAVRRRIEAANTLAQLTEALSGDGVRSHTVQLRAAAETVPLALLDKLGGLRPGQSLAVPRPGGLRVLTVIDARAAPVDRATARKPINAFLLNERRMVLVQQGMAELGKQGQVSYQGPYAAMAPAPDPAPTTPITN